MLMMVMALGGGGHVCGGSGYDEISCTRNCYKGDAWVVMVEGGVGIGCGVVVMAMTMVALLVATMVVVVMMIMVATMGATMTVA